jgi:hypothetical protein
VFATFTSYSAASSPPWKYFAPFVVTFNTPLVKFSAASLVNVVVPEKSATLFAAPPLIVPAPEVPADPDVPELPLEPGAPLLPEVPELPDVPALPDVPFAPDVPELPAVPAVPELPLVPVVPDEPEVPVEPELPDVPVVPELPLVPAEPDVPADPEVPVLPDDPDVPVDPLDPAVPELPEVPDVPLDPAVPAGVNAYDAVPKNPTPFTIELVKDDAETVPATVICDPLSVMIESVTCSNPLLFNILFCVNNVSLPTLLKVCGPTITTDEVTPPAVFW